MGGSGFTGNVNLSVATPPVGISATISPSTVTAGGQATLSVTTGAAPPLGSWTLCVTGASGSLNHTAQLYAVVDGPEPSTIIGPVPGAILNSGSNLFTWNLGAGVSQYALQVGSVPGGYDYANITGNAQTLRQAAGVLGAQVYLPSTLGQTIYATLTSTIGVVQQSQSYTYTIGNRSQYARPTGPTIVTPAPTLYTDYQPVDFTYTFQSGSPQLLNPIVQTGDPTLYGQIISVTPTTATVRYRATAAAPGTSQGSLALSAQISRLGQVGRYRRSPGAQLQSGGGGRFMSCGFDGDEACPVCDPVAVELYGTCGSCDPATQLWCIPAPMPAPPTEVISSPAIPTITQIDFSPRTVVAGAAEQITLYSSNFANWGFTACPVNSSTLQLTGDGCVDPDKTSTGSGTMTINWTTIPRTLGGMTLCIVPKSNFGEGAMSGVCLAMLAFPVQQPPPDPPIVTGNQAIWWLGRASQNDNCIPGAAEPNCYFNATTLQVTPGMGAAAPTANAPAVWNVIDPATGQAPIFANSACKDAACSQLIITATAEPGYCGLLNVQVTVGVLSSAVFNISVDWPSTAGFLALAGADQDISNQGTNSFGYFSQNRLQLISGCRRPMGRMDIHEQFPAGFQACTQMQGAPQPGQPTAGWTDGIPQTSWGGWTTEQDGTFVDQIAYTCIPGTVEACTPNAQTPLPNQAGAAATQFIFVGSKVTSPLGKYFPARPNVQVRYMNRGRDEDGAWTCPTQ